MAGNTYPSTSTYLSVYIYLSTCLHLLIYPSTSTYLSVYIYLSIRLHLLIYPSTSTYLSVYIYLSIRLHLLIYLSTSTYLSVYMYLSICLHILIYPSTSTYLPVYIYLSICLHLLSYLSTKKYNDCLSSLIQKHALIEPCEECRPTCVIILLGTLKMPRVPNNKIVKLKGDYIANPSAINLDMLKNEKAEYVQRCQQAKQKFYHAKLERAQHNYL